MYAAGLDVEGAKGECNFGQHEIGFLYADALTTADNHAVYKTVAKEIAAQHGKSITFMAKYNEREGNSCHIHLSLRGEDGELVFWDRTARARRSTTSSSPACSRRSPTSRCSTRRTSTPTSGSPTARSRRPRSPGASTTAPAPSAWSATAPAPGWRTGCPAATPTPTSRWPRCSPAGCYGIENELELEPAAGRATPTRPDGRRCRRTLAAAREAFAASAIARAALGDEVVDHYANMADVELAAFNAAVTDWELCRGFERL